MLDLTLPETYKLFISEHENEKLSYPQIVSKYKLTITPECLRFRLRAFKKEGVVKIAKRTENFTQEEAQSWVHRNFTISDVFLETGAGYHFIYTACKKYNVKLLDGREISKRGSVDIEQIKSLVLASKDGKHIATTCGISFQQACRYIKKFTNTNNKPVDLSAEKANLLSRRWA